MFTRRSVLSIPGVLMLALISTPTSAQEIITTGPPPELRAHLDSFIKAFNSGSAEEWEAMAKGAFTPGFLKRQTADERKKAYMSLHSDFGTIALERVERQGPDAPIQVFVKGSVASGVIWIELDDASRFDGLKGEVRKTDAPSLRPPTSVDES
jgi:hypothetical protein